MTSATGIPEDRPDEIDPREHEPLLGRSGDVQQREGSPIYYNFLTGTASVAQAGVWVLIAIVWSAIFYHPFLLFSAHPLLNSSAILLQVQAILVLQPTVNARQKKVGTHIHFGLNVIATAAFISALIIIEINKGDHRRLTSPHAILGLITYILIILQVVTGIIQFFLPISVLGSEENGRKLYIYHRIFGYLLIILELATVSAATQTTFNQSALNIHLWSVLVCAVLIILGVGARAKKSNLGIQSIEDRHP